MSSNLILVGVVSAAYHLKGLVKINSYTSDPKNICNLNCIDKEGNNISLSFIKFDKKKIIVRIDGVNDRNEAEKLFGTKLYIKREELPEINESEFYISDLIGIDVIDENDLILGKIHAIHNFGAGDIVEIKFKDGAKEMFPFTKELFPEISKDYIRFIAADLSK